MKVRLTADTTLIHDSHFYTEGDTLEMEGESLRAALDAGHVEPVKKGKK